MLREAPRLNSRIWIGGAVAVGALVGGLWFLLRRPSEEDLQNLRMARRDGVTVREVEDWKRINLRYQKDEVSPLPRKDWELVRRWVRGDHERSRILAITFLGYQLHTPQREEALGMLRDLQEGARGAARAQILMVRAGLEDERLPGEIERFAAEDDPQVKMAVEFCRRRMKVTRRRTDGGTGPGARGAPSESR